MDAMKEVKVWLFNKLHTAAASDTSRSTHCNVMGPLTPQNIPEFVIPGSNESSRRTSECSANDEMYSTQRNSFSGRSCRSSPPGSPVRMSPSESAPCINGIKPNVRNSMSAPVTPKHECRDIINYKECNQTNGLETDDTNVDPLSLSAMSLPHFRAQTSYGFSTLSEMPHTRRKESLFHVGNESLLQSRKHLKISTRDNSLSKSCEITRVEKPISLLNGNVKNLPSTSMPSVVVTSVNSSRQNSPDTPPSCSKSSRRLSPTYQAFHGMSKSPLPTRHNPFYNRRRSSLVGLEGYGSPESPQNSPTDSPQEQNSDTARRSLGDLTVPSASSSSLKRHSAPEIPADKENMSDDENQKPRSRSFHAFSKNQNSSQIFAPFGELKFSFQFLAASQQLKVTLIKAENLGGQTREAQTVNSYVKAYLMPGKVQKQSCNIVKRTKHPVYNQEVYFHNMSLDELHNMALRLKIFSKGCNLKMQEFLGEVTIPLEGYDLLVDNRVWKDLEGRREREVMYT